MTEYIYSISDRIIIMRENDYELTALVPEKKETIVRCKDCRYYREKHGLCAGFGYEWNGELVQVEPEGFCKWAEREER